MDFRSLKRTWVVAEIGVNHEGDVAVAEELIAKAAAAGADAVKFQTYIAENYISAVQPERIEAVRGRALSRDDFRRLAEVARDHGVMFFSTPLSTDDADFLDAMNT